MRGDRVRITEILRMIFVNLIQNKFKVLLTSLGIIIGTVTIILVIAIGRGGEKQIADQFSGMSAETVYINLQYSPTLDTESVEKIMPETLELMLEENPYLRDIYLRTILYESMVTEGGSSNVMLLGVTEGYLEISNFQMEAGEDFSPGDYEEAAKTVILGFSIAEKYYGTPESAIGKYVQLRGGTYRIAGVLKKEAEGLQGVNPDTSVIVPFATALEEGLGGEIGIPQAVGRVKDVEMIPKAMKRMKSTLDYVMEDSSVYAIEDAGSRIDAALQSARTMKLLLVSVAVIVFVVGGIGIMNVLFVSVKERTKEIGILKAIGTSRRDILLLFLLESVGIGVLGGLLGVLLSYVLFPLMAYTDIPIAVQADGAVIALAFAVFTAGIFGFYPAEKAAQLKPVDALNYE